MKKTITFLTISLAINLGISQNVHIPDANFKAALLTAPNTGVDTNGDGEIQVSEAQAWNSPIDVTNKNISDLTGIEAFINIDILACGGNNLTSLNLSQNTKLERLFCMNNQIESLVLNNNTNLTLLYLYNNNLKKLSVVNGNNSSITIFNTTNNPNLKCIQIDSGFTPPNTWSKDNIASYSKYPCKNIIDAALPDKGLLTPGTPLNGLKNSSVAQIVNIPDVNFKNALLNNSPVIDTNNDGEIQLSEAHSYAPYLNIGYKNIQDLTGIEAFINLTYLACAGNNLTKLNVNQNVNLEFLFCAYNPIEKLSLTNNTKLENLSAWNCNFKSLNIANYNNSLITTFDVTNNPNLKCIQIDNGFTPPSSWNKDNIATYSKYPCKNVIDAALPDKSLRTSLTSSSYKINVFPNPAKDFLTIGNKSKDKIQLIEIYNLGGIKVLKTSKKSINISSLTNGIYTLKITTNKKGIVHRKFIKE